MTELKIKRNALVTTTRWLQKQLDVEETFKKCTKGDLRERMKHLKALGTSLNENNTEMACKNELSQDKATENDEFDGLVMS